jgi:uncharacterized protein YcfJ
MKSKAFSAALAVAVWVATPLAQAQEQGRVLSSTPIVQQVGVPHQVCTTEQVQVTPPKSGAGAVMGAIAGGAVANAAVTGRGQSAATMLGLMGGAILGDRIEGAPQPQLQNIQRCTTQTVVESRTVGYQVVYEYAGREYSVQMPDNPGPTIQVQVTPVGAGPAPGTVVGAAMAPVVVAAAPVYVQRVAPPVRVVLAPPPLVVAPIYHHGHDHYRDIWRDGDDRRWH